MEQQSGATVVWSVSPASNRWGLTYVHAEWGDAVGPIFFARMRATTGIAYARLYDRTGSVVAAGLHTNSTNFVTMESQVLTLVDGNEYFPEFGVVPGDAGEYLKAGWSVGLR